MGGYKNTGGRRPLVSSTPVQGTSRGFWNAGRLSYVSAAAPAFADMVSTAAPASVDFLPAEAPASADILPTEAPASVGNFAPGGPPLPDAVASLNSGSVRCPADQWRVYEEVDRQCRDCDDTKIGQGYIQSNDVEKDVIDKLYLIGRGAQDAGHRYAFNLFKTLCKSSRSIRSVGSMMLKTHGKQIVIFFYYKGLGSFLRRFGVGFDEKSKLTRAGFMGTECGAC